MPLFLKKKNFILFFLLILFNMLLISLQAPLGERRNYLERAMFSVFSPLSHGVVLVFQKSTDFINRYFLLTKIKSQNEKLREENLSLRYENEFLLKALERYRSLEEIKEGLLKFHQNILTCRTITFDASNPQKSIVINKGSLDGIKRDMVVIDRYGKLVGRVIEPVTFKEARVQLITDVESGVSVFSRGRDILGILSGDGKGKCVLKYVLSTREVQPGERLLTSGFDKIYPPGIEVGEIISVVTNPTSIFKEIRVVPFFRPQELDYLSVLMKNPLEFLE